MKVLRLNIDHIVIVNVNKQKGIIEMHNMPAFADLTLEQKEIHIVRLPE